MEIINNTKSRMAIAEDVKLGTVFIHNDIPYMVITQDKSKAFLNLFTYAAIPVSSCLFSGHTVEIIDTSLILNN